MKPDEIYKIFGTDYREMTIRLLEEAGLRSQIPENAHRIGIKPNLVSPSPAEFGGTTHPEVVAGIIEYLRANGEYELVILEGSWVGDRTEEAFEVCGYQELSRQYQVELIDLQKCRSRMVEAEGLALEICEPYFELDYLINVPVLKGHCQTKVTCALKNMKGMLPNREKRHFHAMGLHKPIAHLSKAVHQDFIVVDHICGDPDFEDGGNPVIRNCVMAAVDPVLVDAYAAHLLHYETDEISYIRIAEKLGSGSADLDALKVIVCGEGGNDELPRTDRIVELRDAVEEVDSCSACYGYLIPALDQLRSEGLWESFKAAVPDRIAIGQGYRGKTGAVGIGNCTKDFDFCVRGCPPTENEILNALKELIQTRKAQSDPLL